MENKEWNPNEWQGKRKDQVDFSNTVTTVGIIAGIITFLVYGIYCLCGMN